MRLKLDFCSLSFISIMFFLLSFCSFPLHSNRIFLSLCCISQNPCSCVLLPISNAFNEDFNSVAFCFFLHFCFIFTRYLCICYHSFPKAHCSFFTYAIELVLLHLEDNNTICPLPIPWVFGVSQGSGFPQLPSSFPTQSTPPVHFHPLLCMPLYHVYASDSTDLYSSSPRVLTEPQTSCWASSWVTFFQWQDKSGKLFYSLSENVYLNGRLTIENLVFSLNTVKIVFHCLLASVLVTVEKFAFGPIFVPSPSTLLLLRIFFHFCCFIIMGMYECIYFSCLGFTELPESKVLCLESILNNSQALYLQILFLLKFLLDFCWVLSLSPPCHSSLYLSELHSG